MILPTEIYDVYTGLTIYSICVFVMHEYFHNAVQI